MRLQGLRDRLHNERGSVLLFTFTLLVFLLVMGGFAMDFAFQAAARTELQRSIDAAALAGAGKLGFDDTVFPTARANARDYANRFVRIILTVGCAPSQQHQAGNTRSCNYSSHRHNTPRANKLIRFYF